MIRRLALTAVLVMTAAIAFAANASAAKDLVFCSDVSYPPEEFFEGGKAVGSDIDIANDVARRLGMKAKIQNTGFDGIVAALLANKCDAIISGMNDTPERRKSVAFVDYLNVGQSLIVKKDTSLKISGPLDVCGLTAGAQVATTNLQTLQKFNTQCKAKGKKSIKIVSFKQDPLGVTALKTGHLDVYESDSPPAVWYTTKDTSLKITGKPISAIPVGIAIHPKNTSLKTKVQKAINAMYKDGTMAKILKRWNMTQFALKK